MLVCNSPGNFWLAEVASDTKVCRKVNWCVEMLSCDLLIEGNNTRHLHLHKLKRRDKPVQLKNGYS